MISVIIRTKDEEHWIRQCLAAVTRQENVDFEVVLVDNESTDGTLEIAREFGVKIVTLPEDEFSYGRALNLGIAASAGELVCCLSGHCIPQNSNWLFWLQTNFDPDDIAGVYGRQKPVGTTHVLEKRDMWNLFGPEKKVQSKDPFFHNANSMVRRSIWHMLPFDEKANGLEDRIWAKQVLALGYKIIYEPLAAVYHPHGINHAGDLRRAERIVAGIERYCLNGD